MSASEVRRAVLPEGEVRCPAQQRGAWPAAESSFRWASSGRPAAYQDRGTPGHQRRAHAHDQTEVVGRTGARHHGRHLRAPRSHRSSPERPVRCWRSRSMKPPHPPGTGSIRRCVLRRAGPMGMVESRPDRGYRRRSIRSTSMTGAGPTAAGRAYDDVGDHRGRRENDAGALSSSTEATCPSWAPNCGTDSGTATKAGSGLHRPEEGDDAVEALARGMAARSPADAHRRNPRRGPAPGDANLGPRQALRVARERAQGASMNVYGVAPRGGPGEECGTTSRRSPYGVTSSRFRCAPPGVGAPWSRCPAAGERGRIAVHHFHRRFRGGLLRPGHHAGLWLIYQLRKRHFELRRPTTPARTAQGTRLVCPALSVRSELSPVMALCWPFT